MKRHELEHVIRAATAITGAQEIVVVGSQSILGAFPDAPNELLTSNEADVFSFRNDEDAVLIDGSIGERTAFHDTFGYYAHGVAETTAYLPAGWKDRLIRVQNENTGSGAGLCLEAHDLAVSKLIAGRQKDLEFVTGLIRHQLVKIDLVRERLSQVDLSSERKALAFERLDRFKRNA